MPDTESHPDEAPQYNQLPDSLHFMKKNSWVVNQNAAFPFQHLVFYRWGLHINEDVSSRSGCHNENSLTYMQKEMVIRVSLGRDLFFRPSVSHWGENLSRMLHCLTSSLTLHSDEATVTASFLKILLLLWNSRWMWQQASEDIHLNKGDPTFINESNKWKKKARSTNWIGKTTLEEGFLATYEWKSLV